MRDENLKKIKVWETQAVIFNLLHNIYMLRSMVDSCCFLVKFSWPKTLVKKWFNIKSKGEDFQADDVIYGGDCLIPA